MRRESTLAAFKSMAGGMSERLMAMASTVRSLLFAPPAWLNLRMPSPRVLAAPCGAWNPAASGQE